MIFHHQELVDRPVKRVAVATAKLTAAALALAVLTLVSWNMFAPDLFGLSTVRLREALGLIVFGGLVAFMFGHAIRGGRHD